MSMFTASSAAAAANPLALPSGPCRRRRTLRVKSPRLALVEARPGPLGPVIRDGVTGNDNDKAAALVLRTAIGEVFPVPYSRDRTEDMQAEARAMARAANASVYSPELLAAKYGSRPIKVLRRALEIFTGLGSFALNLWLDQLNGLADRNRRLRAIELRQTFTRLGPTFVKIGQGLSTRPDLCPPEYLEELSELQVPGSWSYSEFCGV